MLIWRNWFLQDQFGWPGQPPPTQFPTPATPLPDTVAPILTRTASTVAGPLSRWTTLSAVPFETVQLLLTLAGYGLTVPDRAGRRQPV